MIISFFALATGCAPAIDSVDSIEVDDKRRAIGDAVALQFENLEISGDWVVDSAIPGTAGEYICWDGADLFNSPGVDIIEADFYAPSAGDYQVRIRNWHNHPDPTLENDVFASLDGSSGGGHEWAKLYSNGPGSVGAWTFETRFDGYYGHEHSQQYDNAQWYLEEGWHTLRFSGRSNGFCMDYVGIYREDTVPQSIIDHFGG